MAALQVHHAFLANQVLSSLPYLFSVVLVLLPFIFLFLPWNILIHCYNIHVDSVSALEVRFLNLLCHLAFSKLLLSFNINLRSNRSHMIFEIDVLKKIVKLAGKHMCRSFVLIKLQKHIFFYRTPLNVNTGAPK